MEFQPADPKPTGRLVHQKNLAKPPSAVCQPCCKRTADFNLPVEERFSGQLGVIRKHFSVRGTGGSHGEGIREVRIQILAFLTVLN